MAGYSYTNQYADIGEIRRRLPSVYMLSIAELRLVIDVLDPLDLGLDPAHRMAVGQYLANALERMENLIEEKMEEDNEKRIEQAEY